MLCVLAIEVYVDSTIAVVNSVLPWVVNPDSDDAIDIARALTSADTANLEGIKSSLIFDPSI